MVGDLGEGLGLGETDAAGNADPLENLRPDTPAVFHEVAELGRRRVDERLVDGILLDLDRPFAQYLDDAPRNVSVQLVVGRTEDQIAPRNLPVLQLVVGCTSGDAQRLELRRHGDAAPVVIREDGDRLAVELRVHDPLTRHIEVVAVDKPDHSRWMTAVTFPNVSSSCPDVIMIVG